MTQYEVMQFRSIEKVISVIYVSIGYVAWNHEPWCDAHLFRYASINYRRQYINPRCWFESPQRSLRPTCFSSKY